MFGLHPSGLIQTALENIGAGVAVIDQQGIVAFANETSLKMFGAIKSETPVMFRDWCQNYRFKDSNGQDISFDEFAVTRALKGEVVESQEFQTTLANGNVRWFVTWAYPFSTMGLSGVLALVMDETAQVQLRKSFARLQRIETLGTLAAGLSHDFNNLLNTILSNVALATRHESPPDVIRARLHQIASASEKAALLVQRLMQFSRTQQLHVCRVQVNSIVREALHLVQPLLRDNVVLTTHLLKTVPPIEADRAQIEQLLINLIFNALDAMPLGGRLTISTSLSDSNTNPASRDGSRRFVAISVADTGTGIPLELQVAIFEPFFTTKAAGKGTGLGLSSAYGIARQHGGDIKVQSAPGEGTTFIVLIPVKEAALSNTA